MPSRSDAGEALSSPTLAPLLPVIFAILAAAIGAVTWRSYLTQREVIERGVQTQLLTIADTKVKQIVEWREGRLGQARAIMADSFAVAVLQRVVEGNATAGERTAAEDFLRSQCKNLRFAGAVLVDPNGREVLWEGHRFGNSAHLKPLMETVIRQGDVVQRDFHAEEPGSAPHLGLNMPLRAVSGKVFGGLLLSIDPRDYLYPLHSWPLPSRSGEVLLVRREGDSVLFLSAARRRPTAALQLRIPLSRSDLAVVMAVQGRQGNVEALDYGGVRVFAALRPVPDTPWYLLTQIDSEEVYEPVRRRGVLLAITAASLILTAGAIMLFLWRRAHLNQERGRLQSEIAHRSLAEQYQNLSRFANDVILLLDADGAILTANDRAADVYGYKADELHGMNIRQLRAPVALPSFQAAWQLARERGSLIFETVHQRRDGSEIAVEVSTRSLSVEGQPVMQSIIRDISDRRRAEQELSESESRFRQLVENAPYGILVVDGHFIRYANPEAVRMFGAAGESELVGSSLLDRVLPEERDEVRLRTADTLAGKSMPAIDRRYLRFNGDEFWVAVSATAIDYNHGSAGLLFYRDITLARRAEEERKRLEEQLRQSQKMESVGRLAGGIAHDFNNYLTVINGYCEMLLAGDLPDPETRDSLEQIRSAGERAASTTQRLLAFSRKQMASPRVINLNQVVTDSGQLLRRLISEDIRIVTRLHGQPGNVLADPLQLGQVLMNLVINARDAMPAGGEVTIETRLGEVPSSSANTTVLPGRYAVLAVTDTGTGMTAQVQERIFEPFFTTKAVGEGTGLGLSTVYGIVRQSGGWVEVTSAPGAGSRFEIWLPLAVSEMAGEFPPQPAARGVSGQETLMVVEDQADVRRLAVAILKSCGYHILESGSPEEAVRISESHLEKIDLLVTDVIMPGMNGRQLADRLVAARPDLKVLYTSGYSADVIARQGSLAAGMEYLPKPFGAEQLSAKVRAVLDSGRPPARLLVIDDDAAVRGFLCQVLASAGYFVLEAADGKSGMSQVETGAVDLVITDLVMPEQEGLETLQRLRRQRPELPVIAISGAFGGSFLKAARMLGAVATVAKPIEPETLLKVVHDALSAAGRPRYPSPVGS